MIPKSIANLPIQSQSLTYLWPIKPQSTKYCPLTSSTYASRTVSTDDIQIVHIGTNWLWIVTGHATYCTIATWRMCVANRRTSQTKTQCQSMVKPVPIHQSNANPKQILGQYIQHQSTDPSPILIHTVNPPILVNSCQSLKFTLFFCLQNTLLTNSKIIFSDWHCLRQFCVNPGQSNANPSYNPPLS